MSNKDIDSLGRLLGTELDYCQDYERMNILRPDYSTSYYTPELSQERSTRKAECFETDHKYDSEMNIKNELPLPYGMVKTELLDKLSDLTPEKIRLEVIYRKELFLKEKEEALMNKERELDIRERILELREQIKKEESVEKKTQGTTETFPPDITKQCKTPGTTETFPPDITKQCRNKTKTNSIVLTLFLHI